LRWAAHFGGLLERVRNLYQLWLAKGAAEERDRAPQARRVPHIPLPHDPDWRQHDDEVLHDDCSAQSIACAWSAPPRSSAGDAGAA